ncbi:unnamed protein product [Camellia sinensis]
MAESLACMKAMEWALQHGFLQVVIFSDCKVLVDGLHGRRISDWTSLKLAIAISKFDFEHRDLELFFRSVIFVFFDQSNYTNRKWYKSTSKLMIRWFLKLSQIPEVTEVPSFSGEALSYLQGLIDGFTISDALEVKNIEKVTNHDVKAVEYFLKQKCQSHPEIAKVLEFFHFVCTSEDINNLAHALMLKEALNTVIFPVMDEVIKAVCDMAKANAHVPMFSRTHGQPASPTTLGKEIAIFAVRLSRERLDISQVEIMGKFAGAVGNYNAHLVAYHEIKWPQIAEEFVKSLGLSFNPYVTQVSVPCSKFLLTSVFMGGACGTNTDCAANTTWDSRASPEDMEKMWNHPIVSKEWSKSGEKQGKSAIFSRCREYTLSFSGRVKGPEMVVGWYHSHPGFGCWLSGVDINTQQSFEALNQRAVAVVVDPIQSVKGKVVIDAFRLINPQTMMLGQEPRQTTSNLGHLNKPSIQALIHGLNRHYYSIAINYRKNELEEKMLLNLHKKKWTDGLTLQRFDTHSKTNEQTVQLMNKNLERPSSSQATQKQTRGRGYQKQVCRKGIVPDYDLRQRLHRV